MKSGPKLRVITSTATSAIEQPRQPLRLKLKPRAPTTGYVDGAWWPRSRDLSAELPALLAVLAVRLGHIHRVSYNLGAWTDAPHKIHVDGRLVRLDGFNSRHRQTVDVLGLSSPCLTLLVVPPGTDRSSAHDVLMKAAERGNIDSVRDLLTRIEAG